MKSDNLHIVQYTCSACKRNIMDAGMKPICYDGKYYCIVCYNARKEWEKR